MVELWEPTTRMRAPWWAAHQEWGPGLHEDGFGLTTDDDPVSPVGFDRWVARLLADTSITYRWLVEHHQVLGGIALRHRLTGTAVEAGQLGYGIRPTARGRGLATWAVGQMLEQARVTLDCEQILVVCAADNTASARVIEHHHGRLECIRNTAHGPARRYWITTSSPRTELRDQL